MIQPIGGFLWHDVDGFYAEYRTAKCTTQVSMHLPTTSSNQSQLPCGFVKRKDVGKCITSRQIFQLSIVLERQQLIRPIVEVCKK